jgi:predicted permease
MRPWFGRRRRERDLDDEIVAHVEMAVRDRVERGESRRAAELAVRREFGSRALVAEMTREMWGWPSLDVLRQDIRYGWRMMLRSPAFTGVAMISLAVGIGATTAIFTLIHTLILRPLPVRAPEQLVEPLSRFPGEPRVNGFPWSVYEHFRAETRVLTDLVGVSPFRFELARDGAARETVDGEYVTGNFFSALGVQPGAGRLIAPSDDAVGAAGSAVAVLSWPAWQNRFNGSPSVMNMRVVLNGVPATIVGVAPRGFFGVQVGASPELWVPVAMETLIQHPSRRADGTFAVGLLGRLRAGATIEEARAEMRVLNRWRVEEMARTRNAPFLRQFTIEVEPAAVGLSVLRDAFAKPLLMLMAGVSALLLIACTNVASMLLSRAAARQREMAVRVAIGASRARVARQVLTESLLLSMTSGAIGVLLAYAAARTFARLIVSGRASVALSHYRFAIPVTPDLTVLLFTTTIALAAGVLFGGAPAWHAFGCEPAAALRDMRRTSHTRSRRRFGAGLVVAQVALSVMLVSAAALFVRHLSNLRTSNLGFQRDSVLLVTLDPARSGYQREQLARLYQDLLQRFAATAGVRSATLSGVTPIEGPGAARMITVEGFSERTETRKYVPLNWVAPRYFETFGTPLLAGRDFQFGDAGKPPVAIVNQTMARYYFGAASPIGRRFAFDGVPRTYEIVGLVGDAKYLDLHETPKRTIYLNAFQEGRGMFPQFSLRTTAPPAAVIAAVRRDIDDVLKHVPIAKLTTLEEQMDASIVTDRVIAALSSLFGLFGATLAAIGLYGLLAYTVARRVNEIGVRIALGATQHDVVGLVMGQALRLIALGFAIGVPVVYGARRLGANVMQSVAAASAEQPAAVSVDPVIPVAVAAATLVIVGLVATYVPARRAARVNPADALRSE